MHICTGEPRSLRNRREAWICCQLGARENYAVARALHKNQELELLLTDCWIPPGSLVGRLKPSLRMRFHADLANAEVFASNSGSISFEMYANVTRLSGWHRIVARNARFQRTAISRLRLMEGQSSKRVVVAYS
jgi:hypothetical protein